MCFSFESSIKGWIMVLISSILLILKKDKVSIWIALFSLSFGQMQILEALIWKELDRPAVNRQQIKQLASYVPILLSIQPLVQNLGAYYVTGNKIMLFTSLIYFLILIYQSRPDTSKFDIKVGKHLIWTRYDENKKMTSVHGNYFLMTLYFFGIMFPIYLMPGNRLKYSLLSYGILSVFYALYASKFEEAPSLWCYIIVGYSIIGLLVKSADQ